MNAAPTHHDPLVDCLACGTRLTDADQQHLRTLCIICRADPFAATASIMVRRILAPPAPAPVRWVKCTACEGHGENPHPTGRSSYGFPEMVSCATCEGYGEVEEEDAE